MKESSESSHFVARLLEALVPCGAETALVFEGRALTFGELDALSRVYAERLSRLGLAPGDRVAVFTETCPEIVSAFVGHLRSGVIQVPINPRYRSEEARHILEDSGACAVLCQRGDACAPVLDEILSSSPPPALKHRLEIAEMFAPGEMESCSTPVPSGAEPAVLIYTSGTTGKSKGVALSYRAVAENTLAVAGMWRFTSEDRLVLALPLFHVHGLCLGVTGALLHGSTILLERRYDAARVVEAFASGGAPVFLGVPTMYVRLLEYLDAHPEGSAPLAKARLFTSGSAPLPASDFAAFKKATGHAILERYGMSETLFTLSNPYDGERRPGTVGLPVPGCAVRIVDDEGRDGPDGELGELLVRSNGIMNGYWRREAETAVSFRDGWFVTGDMASRDRDGYVTILGRKSVDFIKSGGFKISAREVEEVLRRHAAVKDVAVVGAPDRVWGERIVAAVVLDERPRAASDRELLCAELSAFAARFLADYKRPREVRIVDELPRNALGKVQKHRLLGRSPKTS
jgi:acyl-CoA synthetase (AMP-forming)/AMP-acid ligase II